MTCIPDGRRRQNKVPRKLNKMGNCRKYLPITEYKLLLSYLPKRVCAILQYLPHDHFSWQTCMQESGVVRIAARLLNTTSEQE